VADAILEKLGTLTEEEWALIKRHPEVGARMIEPLEFLSGALPVIRHHHERLDGTGAVVDAYDVMLQGRPYRPERYPPKRYGSQSSPAEALQELWREAGRQFDVRVVEAMGRLFGDPKISSTDSSRTL